MGLRSPPVDVVDAICRLQANPAYTLVRRWLGEELGNEYRTAIHTDDGVDLARGGVRMLEALIKTLDEAKANLQKLDEKRKARR